MMVTSVATITVAKSMLEAERADLMSNADGTFDPTSLQLMQSVGASCAEDRGTEFWELLQESADYEFCTEKAFSHEDVRVTQLDSFLSAVSTDRMRKHS